MKKKFLRNLEKEIKAAKKIEGFKECRIVINCNDLDFNLANPLTSIENIQIEVISSLDSFKKTCYIDENGTYICKILS